MAKIQAHDTNDNQNKTAQLDRVATFPEQDNPRSSDNASSKSRPDRISNAQFNLGQRQSKATHTVEHLL